MNDRERRVVPDLDAVDWSAVLGSSRSVSSRMRARAKSLSALFATRYAKGLAAIDEARSADPLNPLHTLRLAMLNIRFGRLDESAEVAQELCDTLPDPRLPLYVRGLATLRKQEFRRAANIAAELIAKAPKDAPAKFLQAEAQLGYQFKGFQKLVAGLPRGPEHEAMWADLLVKMILTGPEEAVKVATQAAGQNAILPEGSSARAFVNEAMRLREADLDTLTAALGESPVGSRREQVILLLILDRAREAADASARFRTLLDRHPDRPSLRRVYVSYLTNKAVEEARQERYHDALRLIERCTALEPHESLHHQNRAAIFTLLRESDAYHDAWLELNRHHYRLALIGRLGPDDASEIARPHRMFAQQARFVPEAPGTRFRKNLGLFIEDARPLTGGEPQAVLNQERIADDPDLLRQWIHHRRAELTFEHAALGADPSRFLLHPDDPAEAKARMSSLTRISESLPVLVPDEGTILAGQLVASWTALASKIVPSYTRDPDDPDVRKLLTAHVETIADLALICLTWKPPTDRPDLIEDVLDLLDAEAPFFDEGSLDRALRETDRPTDRLYPLKLLSGVLGDRLGTERTGIAADLPQRLKAISSISARLLLNTSFAMYESARGTRLAVERSLPYLDRARLADPSDARIELAAARLLLLGDYHAESRASLASFHRMPGSRDPEMLAEADEIRKLLEDRKRQNVAGQRREGKPAVEESEIEFEPQTSRDTTALEAIVERDPGSVHAYEDLARRLAEEGRFAQAIAWCDRAVSRCLAREAQIRARSLHMEVLGLEILADANRPAVAAYLSGSHDGALAAIEPLADSAKYPLLFLLGNVLLASRRPHEAREAFEKAMERCDRQSHRAVLRGLSSNIDAVYLTVARKAIQDHVRAGRLAEARREAVAMLGLLVRPEAGLIDLANLHLAAASRVSGDVEPLDSPAIPIDVPWSNLLKSATSAGTDIERARKLAELVVALDPGSKRAGETLLAKVAALVEQAKTVAALAESGRLLREGQFEAALKALDASGESGESEPRVLRQKAMLLLKLERFDEADAIASALRQSTVDSARQFVAAYPALRFRQRMATGNRLLREGHDEEAARVLALAEPPDSAGAMELGYSRAFGLAMKANRLRREGLREEWVATLDRAMEEIEHHVPAARASGHSRLLELYEMLDKDLASPSAKPPKGGSGS